jgi:hypothetical protein
MDCRKLVLVATLVASAAAIPIKQRPVDAAAVRAPVAAPDTTLPSLPIHAPKADSSEGQ